MMLRRLTILVAAATVLASGSAGAQGSVFALRGMGWSARPVSSRTAGTAGAMAMFDPAMALNPAAMSRWRSVAAWAVAAPTSREYKSPFGNADLQTVRFPLIGFAAPVPPRTTLGFSLSDYLDRTWTLTQRDSMLLNGTMEPYTDAGRSVGGVTDIQVAMAYRVHSGLQVGAAFHLYLGSTRLTAQRVFDNTVYEQIIEQSSTDFRGPGVGVGVSYVRGRLELGLSGRLNGKLLSTNTGGNEAKTRLPAQLGLGLRWQPVSGVFLAGSAQYDAWSSADESLVSERALDVWSLAAGVEVLNVTLIKVRTPMRFGYRMRRLPFTSLGEAIEESGFAAGFGLNLARDRATVDLSFERGSRETPQAKETFNSIFVGLTVRP